MFIRSERLFLRPGWPEDWAELLALIDDEAVVRNLSRAPWPFRPDDARALASRATPGRFPDFIITLPGAHGTRLIGMVGMVDHQGEAELGFWIAQQHWNRGYATESLRAALAVARTLGHARVTCCHFVDNPACGRVLAKLGFAPTGDVRLRFCAARGGLEPTVVYALELAQAGNCDSGDDGNGSGGKVMRAA